MSRISDWYSSLGEFSFPTVFLRLGPADVQALVQGEMHGPAAEEMMRRLQRAIKSLPGFGFVGADSCAPTDSPHFRYGAGLFAGRSAWRLVTTSEKVRNAFQRGETERLTVRPFRRMDRTREFRMFFFGRKLVAMSQYFLERHFHRLEKREDEIWTRGKDLATRIAPFLPQNTLVVDVYLCSDGEMLMVDANSWGGDTDPKLLKTWDRNWEEEVGLKLIPRPIKMKGDISVSF